MTKSILKNNQTLLSVEQFTFFFAYDSDTRWLLIAKKTKHDEQFGHNTSTYSSEEKKYVSYRLPPEILCNS